MNDEVNDILRQHQYQYVKPLGSGSYGDVYLVNSEKYNEQFAVKIIPRRSRLSVLIDTDDQEVSALMNLCHVNVIKLYDFWIDKSLLFIVLEYCPGGSMKEVIEERGPVPMPCLLKLFIQIISGLAFCHEKGISHRDIKPANILIDSFGRPRLADFGLSRQSITGALSNAYLGSPITMAPEIVRKRPFNPFEADIWALGVTFFIMATGKTPWIAYNIDGLERSIMAGSIIYPSSLNRSVASFLGDILKMVPSSRPTASQLLNHPIFKQLPENVCCCKFLKCSVGCPKTITSLFPSQIWTRKKSVRVLRPTFADIENETKTP